MGFFICLRRLMRAVYFVAAITIPQVVLADQAPTSDRAELAARVEQANKLYQKQKYQEALPIYQDIYIQTKEPTMLFSMGQCYRNLKQLPEAAESYRSFLQSAPPESEFVPIAQQLLQEVESQLPKEQKPPKDKKKIHPLYLGAVGVGALSLGVGATSLTTLLLGKNKEDNGDAEGAASLLKVSALTAPIADIAAVVSLGLAAGGFVLSKKKTSAALLIGPTQATLSLEF
jgi:tetratricopeptide (TPR) repeat protein